jgi:hypothetical protein
MTNQSDFPIEFSKKKSFLLHIWRINIQKLIPDFWFEYDPFFKISMNFKKTNNYSPNKKIDFFSSLNPNLKFLCHISDINFSNCILSKTPEIYNFINSAQFYFSALRKISLIYFSISRILIEKMKYYLSKYFQILDIKINIYRFKILFSFLIWWEHIKYF